jgi:hypothetical protein
VNLGIACATVRAEGELRHLGLLGSNVMKKTKPQEPLLDQSLAHLRKIEETASGKGGRRLPSAVEQSGILKPGDVMVVECGPLSAEDTDTSAPAIELLRKLGFGKERQEWPSTFFGPVLPEVLKKLKGAHQILTSRGFVFIDDPLNPLGDGRSWVLKCEPPDKLPNNSDPARLAGECLQAEGIKVAKRPVLDGDTLLIPLWDSGEDSAAELHLADSGNTAEITQSEQYNKKGSSKGRPRSVAVSTRRELLRKIATTGVRGVHYCQALVKAGLSTPLEWQKRDGCPKSYAEAWDHPDPQRRKTFRHRISDEKYKATRQHSPEVTSLAYSE